MRNIKLLSIVIPCHNEQEVLPDTHKRLKSVLNDLVSNNKCDDYELVLVDNGSTDGSVA